MTPEAQKSVSNQSALPTIPYGRQSIGEEDIAAVVAVLKSDWLTCGPAVERFERTLAASCGAKYAIAVCNGTAALHVAMLAAGIQPGQRVITSPNTFLASANCAEFVGAHVDFVDIDGTTLNLDPKALAQTIMTDVKAVVTVDFAGRPSELPAINRLAKAAGACVIEDAAHSLGSSFEYAGRRYRVGGHPWADMATLSFHPVKTITTGEGGAILTDDENLARRCRRFRSHGMIRDNHEWVQQPNSLEKVGNSDTTEMAPWYYEMQELGYNYRITDFQCALGEVQLSQLEGLVRRRAEIVSCYDSAFSDLPMVKIAPHSMEAPMNEGISYNFSDIAWHLYVLQIDFVRLGKTRSQIMSALRSKGVGTQVHYIPVHLQPYYRRKYGFKPGKCPVAEKYYSQALSLPLFAGMSDRDVQQVISAIRSVVE